MSRILEFWQNLQCFNVVCSLLQGGSCCNLARRGCSWQHPDKNLFFGLFHPGVSERLQFYSCDFSSMCPALSTCTAGSVLLTPLSSWLHCCYPGRSRILAFTQKIVWLSSVSFLVWHLISATSLPFQTHSHLLHTCSLSWSKHDAYFLLANEYNLWYPTPLYQTEQLLFCHGFVLAITPWGQSYSWGNRGLENLRSAPNHIRTSRWVESSSITDPPFIPALHASGA